MKTELHATENILLSFLECKISSLTGSNKFVCFLNYSHPNAFRFHRICLNMFVGYVQHITPIDWLILSPSGFRQADSTLVWPSTSDKPDRNEPV